jgi:endonuclease YncB( thermonuclease family)
MYRSLLSILLLPLFFQPLLKGRVVGIADGDTFTLLTPEHVQYKIRLHGIDAPEKGQDFGNRSKQALGNLIAGKDVEVQDRGKDRYGRTIGMVFLKGKNINEEMLRQGMAWHFLKYDKNPRWSELEGATREAHVGLWSQPGAVAPWDWRKAKKAYQ